MTKPAENYHGFLGLLQIFEKHNQLQKESVNIVCGSSSGHHPFKKGKKKNKKKMLRARAPKLSQRKKSKVNKNQA